MHVFKKIQIFDVIAYLIITLASVAALYPFINVIAVSLSTYAAYIKNPLMLWPEDTNVEAYKYMFGQANLGRSYLNTIFVTGVTVAIGIALTILTAYPLAQTELKGKPLFMNYIIFTMLFNGGLIPNFLLIKNLGLYDSLWALILTAVFSAYNLILMKSFIENIPKALFESARIDGASDWRILVRIVVPLSTPIIATLSLFIAVAQWNSFFSAVIYISDSAKWTLQLLLREIIMKTAFSTTGDAAESQQMLMPDTIKCAAVVIVMVPIMCIYPFIQKYFIKGIMLGAVKG